VQVQHFLHEGDRSNAAVAFDGARDPGRLSPPLVRVDVVLLPRQADQRHDRDDDADRESDQNQPQHPAFDHGGEDIASSPDGC
jgi:hypothetical protein